MVQSKTRFRICLFLLLPIAMLYLPTADGATAVQDLSHGIGESVDLWTGTEEIRAKNFEAALKELESDTVFEDTAYHFFKLATAQKALNDISLALLYYRYAAERDELLAPAAYVEIGHIEFNQGRPLNALSAYRSALEYSIPQRFQRLIYQKISDVVLDQKMDITTLTWLPQDFANKHFEMEVTKQPILDSCIAEKDWFAVDSIIEKYLEFFSLSDQCRIFKPAFEISIPDSIRDSLFSTNQLYQISKKAYACGAYKHSSDWLHYALDRNDFLKNIERKDYYLHRGMLNYKLRNYNSALKWLHKYDKKYTSTPEVVLTIARSYRNLGRRAKSNRWYDAHVRLFPSHNMTHDILWYRAWQHEEDRDFDEAIKLYLKLFTLHKNGSRADNAIHRIGLAFYKEGKYGAAFRQWNLFLKRFPNSYLVPAAYFWQGKSLYNQGKYEDAELYLKRLLTDYPVDYYAWRAREVLSLISDTIPLFSFQTTSGVEGCRAWLDSITPEKNRYIRPTDSIYFSIGSKLAFSGYMDIGEFYLEPLEIKYRENLTFLFDLSTLYKSCGYPTLSFRIAKQFSWNIPQRHRKVIPFSLYRILYPDSYADIITEYADLFTVEPGLISAVIRQESMFNYEIVSPAGAIGLMQIMPATGKNIAAQLSEPFTTDSLYNPRTNIRFGAFYLRQLLDKFDGNIVLALASYNGGPHNAKRWYESNSEDAFDLFIESISFTETRGYVKKVLGNYWTYTHFEKLLDFLLVSSQ